MKPSQTYKITFKTHYFWTVFDNHNIILIIMDTHSNFCYLLWDYNEIRTEYVKLN